MYPFSKCQSVLHEYVNNAVTNVYIYRRSVKRSVWRQMYANKAILALNEFLQMLIPGQFNNTHRY